MAALEALIRCQARFILVVFNNLITSCDFFDVIIPRSSRVSPQIDLEPYTARRVLFRGLGQKPGYHWVHICHVSTEGTEIVCYHAVDV